MRLVRIRNLTSPLHTPLEARHCQSFLCRLRGLMFQATIRPQCALLLVEPDENRINAAIHMLFMRFPIAVIWINARFQVVDVKLAFPWRSVYLPAAPAKFILEAHASRLIDFHTGDQLEFEYV